MLLGPVTLRGDSEKHLKTSLQGVCWRRLRDFDKAPTESLILVCFRDWRRRTGAQSDPLFGRYIDALYLRWRPLFNQSQKKKLRFWHQLFFWELLCDVILPNWNQNVVDMKKSKSHASIPFQESVVRCGASLSLFEYTIVFIVRQLTQALESWHHLLSKTTESAHNRTSLRPECMQHNAGTTHSVCIIVWLWSSAADNMNNPL